MAHKDWLCQELGKYVASESSSASETEEYSDSDEEVDVPGDAPYEGSDGEEVPGRGDAAVTEHMAEKREKRQRMPSKRYSSAEWVRYDDSDSET